MIIQPQHLANVPGDEPGLAVDQHGADFLRTRRDCVLGSPKRANQDSWGGDRRSIDYYLTIEAAKHIAMMGARM